jgi:hypothetical protein
MCEAERQGDSKALVNLLLLEKIALAGIVESHWGLRELATRSMSTPCYEAVPQSSKGRSPRPKGKLEGADG